MSVPLHELLGVCLTERFESNEIQPLSEFVDRQEELVVGDVPIKTIENYGAVTIEDVKINVCLKAGGYLHIEKLSYGVGINVKSNLFAGTLIVKIERGILPKTNVRISHLIATTHRDEVVLDDARRIVNGEGKTVHASHSAKLSLGLLTAKQYNT